MDGYVWRGYNRSYIHRNAPKASGGVGLLIKQWIFEEFDYETLDMSFKGILCSKFTSKHSDYNFLVFHVICHLKIRYGAEIRNQNKKNWRGGGRENERLKS